MNVQMGCLPERCLIGAELAFLHACMQLIINHHAPTLDRDFCSMNHNVKKPAPDRYPPIPASADKSIASTLASTALGGASGLLMCIREAEFVTTHECRVGTNLDRIIQSIVTFLILLAFR